MIEKKIYSPWAFSNNENEKYKINREIYQEIKDKAKLKLVNVGYAHRVYEVLENSEDLTDLELALIADKGNLCFGYRTKHGKIIIHTD